MKDFLAGEHRLLDLPEGSRVTDAVCLLRASGPAPEVLWGSIAIAVNRQYAGRQTMLQEGDELALLPPVSGGAPDVAPSPGVAALWSFDAR